MSLEILTQLPIIVGLVSVAVAILQRAYKTFLEKREIDPKLQFNHTYLLNTLVTTGVGVALVTVVIPAVIEALSGANTQPINIASIFLNFAVGYGLTYTILDQWNKSTGKTIEIQELKEEIEETK